MNQILKTHKTKRGQITIFVIIAIALIASIAVFLYLREQTELSKQQTLPPESRDIREYIQYCVDTSLIDGTRLVGLQGGYFAMPQNYLHTNLSDIAYGYYLGKDTLATNEIIQNEIASYMNLVIPICFDTNDYPTLDIKTKQINPKVKIDSTRVSAEVTFPIVIRNINETSAASEIAEPYYSEIPVRLDEIRNFARSIVEKEVQDPVHADISYLLSSKYQILIFPYDNKTTVYSIIDNSSQVENISYVFQFANKFP